MGVFDFLETENNQPKKIEEICKACGIKFGRPFDFLDCLVGMGHIDKTDDNRYFNTPEASAFCVKTSKAYIGATVHFRCSMQNNIFSNLPKMLKGEEYQKMFNDFG
jgi:predicted transcriptional regulator